jgi:hypothetical protein
MRPLTLPRCLPLLLALLAFPFLAQAQEASISLSPGYLREPYSESIVQTLKEKYRLNLTGASSASSFQWQAVGPLPPGLTIDPSSGTVFGTPMMARNAPYQFRVNVFDRASTSPAPLKLLVELKVTRGTRPLEGDAPRLEAIPATPEPHHTEPESSSVAFVQTQANQDFEIPTIVPRKELVLPITIKSPLIRQLEFRVFNKEKKLIDTQRTPDDLARGVVRTSVKLKLEEGLNKIEVWNADVDERLQVIEVTLKATDVDKPQKAQKPALEVRHSGFVSKGETTTPVTIYVGDENISAVTLAVKEKEVKDGKEVLTDLPGFKVKQLDLKRGLDEYEETIPVSSDDKKSTVVVITEVGAKGTARDKSFEIKRATQPSAEKPEIQVGYSRFIGDFIMSTPLQITVNDPNISKVKVLVTPKDKAADVAHEETVEVKRGEPSFLHMIKLPGPDVRDIDVKVIGLNINNTEVKTEPLKLERRTGGEAASTIITNSLTTRAIIGFEQAGASSADSKQSPFIDLFFTAPLYFGEKRDKSNDNKPFDPPRHNSLPTLSAWGQIRLAAIPQQAATFGTFASDFVNPLTEGKLVELVQGFDFLAGLEVRLYGSDKGYIGLLPGIKQRTFVNLVAGGGAISPLSQSQNRSSAQIFKVPGENSPQRDLFIRRFGKEAATKQHIAFVFPDRDRFLRQFYAGFRFKTFYFDGDSPEPINRFPAILDVMLGQNEAVTGGRLKSLVTNDDGKVIGERRNLVLRLEAFYPFPIREASFLYLYGTAMMKLGGKGVRVTTPLFLTRSDGDVSVTSDGVLIVPNLQADRDYYRIGVGVNLTELFNRRRPRN